MLDGLLLVLLIVALPGYMIWRSIAGRGKPAKARLGRYVHGAGIALALVALLLVDWMHAGRSAGALGLDLHPSTAGMIGLVSAACILTAFWVVARAQFKIAKPADRMEIDDLLPRTSTELAAFIAFTLVAGCSWELLFRGYLMWALPPHLGLVGSVVVAATAYGVAHGYTNIRAFAASLASALLFTIAFAATKSLWWLMVVHCGLPLIAAMMAQAQRPALPAPTEP